MTLEDLQLYLPKYLSSNSERILYQELSRFPENMDKRIYSKNLVGDNVIYQGDGLNNLLVVNLPDTTIKEAPCMVISNTCDMDLANKRFFPSHIIYAPIFNLKKYQDILIKNEKPEEAIKQHVGSIKRQEITQIFYLPKFEDVIDDSIVFLDRINNHSNKKYSRDKLNSSKLFTLSDYGAYLFLFKLSFHLTRIQDKVDRGSLEIK